MGDLRWIVRVDGNPVPPDAYHLESTATGHFSFRPAVAGHSRTFTIMAQQGGMVSEPLTIAVNGAAGAGAPAATVAAAAQAPSLWTDLPRDLKNMAASFGVRDFKGIDSAWALAAHQATHKVDFRDEITKSSSSSS